MGKRAETAYRLRISVLRVWIRNVIKESKRCRNQRTRYPSDDGILSVIAILRQMTGISLSGLPTILGRLDLLNANRIIFQPFLADGTGRHA